MNLPSNVQEIDPYLRLPAVLEITGSTESTIYRWIGDEKFPAPHRLGPNTVGWRQSTIKQWCANRPAVRPRASALPDGLRHQPTSPTETAPRACRAVPMIYVRNCPAKEHPNYASDFSGAA